jgi:subtilisin family serine protease
MRRNNRKNDCSLLPYIKENVYGLSPNDPEFYGWEIKKFDIPNHWKFSKGENTKIAVIDTGCDLDHPDLKDNLLDGKNFVDPTKPPLDVATHGTHVAGTIAAIDNGKGMVGVAPRAKIIPIKALDDKGNGNISNISNAIIWAADQKADFISMSLGSSRSSTELENAIKYAYSKGIIIFCAAGNSGPNTEIMYPARYKQTISIAAIDEKLERTSFSCSGDSLDFLAPGDKILSTVPDNSYAIMSGTSMSTPFAVGCAALYLSYLRKTKNDSRFKISMEDLIEAFKNKAKPLTDPKYQSIKYQGYGILYPAP